MKYYVNNVQIHAMQIDDYNEIYELWNHTAGMGLSDADTQTNIHKFLLRNKDLSFVCRHESKIIGTILCGHDGRRGYIYHVTVAEEYRGRGIGNAFWTSTGWTARKDVFVYSNTL